MIALSRFGSNPFPFTFHVPSKQLSLSLPFPSLSSLSYGYYIKEMVSDKISPTPTHPPFYFKKGKKKQGIGTQHNHNGFLFLIPSCVCSAASLRFVPPNASPDFEQQLGRRKSGRKMQRVPGEVGFRRFVPSLRLLHLPLRRSAVQLPEVRPPRQVVPQVSLAAPLLRSPQVFQVQTQTRHVVSPPR